MSDRTLVQESAYEKFTRLRVGALFMEQGTGKTRVALDVLSHSAHRIDLVVWVCPFAVKATVRAEVARWGCEIPVDVVAYETLSGSDRTYLELLARIVGCRAAIVADESIFIKNADSKRSQRVNELRKGADFALVLNGTPITRDLWDLKRQVDFLDPRIIGMGDSEFRNTYFTTIRYRKASGESGEFDKVHEPNVAHLMSLVDPYVLFADLTLGVRETTTVRVHEPGCQAVEEYEWLKGKTLDAYRRDGGDGWEFLRMLSRLAYIAGTDPVKTEAIAREVTGRCIVFTTWLEETWLIADHLDTPFVVTGDTVLRSELVDEWRASDQPLLMTIGTGAFGLNLQDASTVHFASLGFDFARVEQARKRVRRLGQTRDLRYVEHDSALGISTVVRENLRCKDFLARLVRRAIDLEGVL